MSAVTSGEIHSTFKRRTVCVNVTLRRTGSQPAASGVLKKELMTMKVHRVRASVKFPQYVPGLVNCLYNNYLIKSLMSSRENAFSYDYFLIYF